MRLLLPVFFTGLLLLGIFLLPYSVPMHQISNSQAWEYGFNSTVAQGMIALMLLGLFLWQLFLGRLPMDRDLIFRTILPPEELESPRLLLYTMGFLQLVTCILVLGWYSILPLSHYGEITYFIQRIEAMVLGGRPYVDFAFDYGPAMLALPVGIYRAFGGAISVEAAYTATLIIHYTIGFALVAYVVSQLNARGRVMILALVGFQWINPTMGLNYTPLRFTIALASLFAVRHLYRVTRGWMPARAIALLGLVGFLLPLVNFSISPEMGLALTVSLAVYFAWFALGPERKQALLVVPVLAGVMAAAVLFPRPYFDSMLSFGTGGANFPLFPTIHIVAFLAAAIWVFPRLGVIAIREREAAPFAAGLAILCGLFILPATGRCDSGHVWINGMGMLMVALGAASWLKPRWWHTVLGVYALIFPVMQEFATWDGYKDQMEGVVAMRNQLGTMQYESDNFAKLAPGDARPAIHYSKLLPAQGLDSLPKAKIGLPLGDVEVMERFLKLSGRYVPEYHIAPYGDIFDATDLVRKYADMKAMEYVFVPTSYLAWLQPMDEQAEMQQQGAADCKFLSGILLFPVDLPAVHPLFRPDRDIIRHIAQEYQVAARYQSGILLRRKDATTAAPTP